jgi:hypothetical protein
LCTPVIPAFERLRQVNQEFETSLGQIMRTLSQKGRERERKREREKERERERERSFECKA